MTEQLHSVWLRSNKATGAAVTEILGLPNLNWTDVQIEFGLNAPAIAKVSLLITAEQLTALAQLAAIPPQDRTVWMDDSPLLQRNPYGGR